MSWRLTTLMLGPKPVRPMSPPWLLKARMSVETTSPLALQELRLKEAAMLLGPTNVVAHLYCPKPARTIVAGTLGRMQPSRQQ